MTRHTLTQLTQTALSTAVVSILSQIALLTPTGVPVTLQTFAAAFAGYLLLPRLAVCSIALYLCLGAVGVPVFAAFRGGLPHLFQLTGGFLWGLPALSFFCGIGGRTVSKKTEKDTSGALSITNVLITNTLRIVPGLFGLGICHILGILQYAWLSGQSFRACFLLVSAPYLLKDMISVAAASLLGRSVRARLTKADLI